MITVLLLFFPAWASAVGAPWFELEPNAEYSLSQDITVGGHPFSAGTRLFLEEREPLSVPGAPLSFFVLHEVKCLEPDSASQLEIILPEGSPTGSEVGVELSEGCNWGIYVEDKDLFTPSLFRVVR